MEDILKAKKELDLKIKAMVQEFIEEHKISYVGNIRGLVVRQNYDSGLSAIINAETDIDTFLKL